MSKIRKKCEATIRPVEKKDYENLARFFEENNRSETTRQFHPFPLTLQTAYAIVCMNHRDRYYVAVSQGHTVGLCMLRGWDEGFEVPSFGVCVDSLHRGFALGRRLTDFAVAEARRLGCRWIRLSTYASNKRAVHLFTSLGFREITRERVIVEGEPDERIFMMNDLTGGPIAEPGSAITDCD